MCDDCKHGLEIMQAKVYTVNLENGWFDNERSVGDESALLHSEVSEFFEAYRKQTGEMGEELADILIRVLDVAQRHHIDLYGEFAKKLEKNRKRGYRHGGRLV